MPIRIVRLGEPREPDEGIRLGTVRRPPRGVKKEDYARRNFYDAWLPELSPAAELVSWAMAGGLTDSKWKTFARRYRAEMSQPAAQHLLELLAVLSRTADFSVGCYCEDESRCHRSLLRELLVEKGAKLR
jgi:uncharacterized protein YeaO (DUF488 family)